MRWPINWGVGPKTFARYENLSVRQSKAMDNLLRILDRFPEAIKILEGNCLQKMKNGHFPLAVDIFILKQGASLLDGYRQF